MGFMSSNVSISTRSAQAIKWQRGMAQTLLSLLGSPWPWLLALLMFGSGSLAYLAPFRFDLKIGGYPPTTAECWSRDIFDVAYLNGFNQDPEYNQPREQCAAATTAYRWAFSEAQVRVPGIGRAPLQVSLHVSRGQPGPTSVASGWQLGEAPLVAVPLQQDARVYHVLAPLRSSDLDLQIHTPPFAAPGDSRELAFAAEALSIVPLERTMPAWSYIAICSAVVGIGYLGLRRAAVPSTLAVCAGVGLIIGFTVLIAWWRTPLTLIAYRLLALLIAGIGIGIALRPCGTYLAQRLGISVQRRDVQLIVVLVVLAWLVRTVGLLHPQAMNSDIGLNINNLVHVIQGNVIFTEPLPDDAGGGAAPYPPAQYLMLAPFTLLGLDHKTLIIVGNALADSLTIFWLWLLIRAVGLGQPAAIFAGLLYVFATPLLRSLSIGEMANVWGQALVAPWVLALVLWRQGRVSNTLFVIATLFALLGHFGVLLSALLFAATLAVVWLLRRDPYAWRYIAMGSVAMMIVVLGYYADATLRDAVLSRPAAPPPSTSLQHRFGFQLAQLATPSGLIGPLLATLGLAGMALAQKRVPLLGDLLIAWWCSVALSWATLLFSQQALRWPAFIMPAVALGGGLLLAELWQRRTQFRVLAGTVVIVALLHGSWLWIDRIATYNH